jgi:hypothetical protein
MDLGDATAAPDQTILARWVAGDYVRYLYAERNPIRIFIFLRNDADRRVIQLTVNRDCCGALTRR